MDARVDLVAHARIDSDSNAEIQVAVVAPTHACPFARLTGGGCTLPVLYYVYVVVWPRSIVVGRSGPFVVPRHRGFFPVTCS